MFNFRMTTVVKNILIINILLFFASVVLQGDMKELFNQNLLGYTPTSPGFKIWQPITSMFMHADIGHLFGNMIGLFFFGPRLEMNWGSKRFLTYYMLTGLGAYLIFYIVMYTRYYMMWDLDFSELTAIFYRDGHTLRGASGAIFGILIAYGLKYPNDTVMLLFPPIPMKMKWLITLYLGYELYTGFYNTGDGVGHFAHLGGALTGFIILKIWQLQKENRTKHFQ